MTNFLFEVCMVQRCNLFYKLYGTMHELGNNDSKPSHVDEIHQIELLFMIHVLTTKYLKNIICN